MTDDGFCICSALATPHELPGVYCGCRGRLRLLLENFTLGSEANELTYGISGVGGMPEPCNTPIQPGIVGMSFNINAQHFAGQPIRACSLPKVLILELGGDMFFLDFQSAFERKDLPERNFLGLPYDPCVLLECQTLRHSHFEKYRLNI